jgi:cytochrome c oxidase subunit 2
MDLPHGVTPIETGMRSFNSLLTAIIVAIVVFVFALLVYVIWKYRESANPTPSKTSHNTTIEILWTVVPVLILVVIAIPSFRLLYFQYSFPKPDVTVKVTGKQWYWTYEYPDLKNVSFDSYPIPDTDIKPGQVRTLSVDNEMVVPINKIVHVLITGGDVIHQWVVPAFGTRADAIPGRINRQWFLAKEKGLYYGQCSALCGNGHPYMPIAVRVVSEEEYAKWVAGKQATASAAPKTVVASASSPQNAQ